MPTHAELTARLLVDAAQFFRTLGSQNEKLTGQMNENATVFEQMSDLMVQDPNGSLEGTSNAELSSRLLRDAAAFFRTLAEQNAPIQDQMNDNARVFEDIADRVANDPDGVME